jgi:hypothetical protein
MVVVNIATKHLIYKDLEPKNRWLFHNVFHRCGKLEGLLQDALNQDISNRGR